MLWPSATEGRFLGQRLLHHHQDREWRLHYHYTVSMGLCTLFVVDLFLVEFFLVALAALACASSWTSSSWSSFSWTSRLWPGLGFRRASFAVNLFLVFIVDFAALAWASGGPFAVDIFFVEFLLVDFVALAWACSGPFAVDFFLVEWTAIFTLVLSLDTPLVRVPRAMLGVGA